MSVRAKVHVGSAMPYYGDPKNGVAVSMYAVYSSNPDDPNFSYSQATPQARFDMVITNPDASDYFEPHAEYIVTFEKVEKKQSAA